MINALLTLSGIRSVVSYIHTLRTNGTLHEYARVLLLTLSSRWN